MNPVAMGLESHEPILEVVRTDPEYQEAFRKVFGKTGAAISMTEVTKALAAFERTLVGGNSPFDRWYFAGEESALTESQKRGFDIFVNEGRCVSCHTIEQTTALFTDNRFHNVGVGIDDIQQQVPGLAREFLKAEATLTEVDHAMLTDPRTSELGRFSLLPRLRRPRLFRDAHAAEHRGDGAILP